MLVHAHLVSTRATPPAQSFAGKDLPEKPARTSTARPVAFDAVLQERYTTARGSEYVRLTLGAPQGSGDPADVIDAEFIFLTGACVWVWKKACWTRCCIVRGSEHHGAVQCAIALSVYLYC